MLALKIEFGRFSLKWIIGFLFILFRIYFNSSKQSSSNTFEITLTDVTQSGVGNGL